MADYKGLKIPEKITLVARDITHWDEGRTIRQAYVVPAGDKKMLESAHIWADWTDSKWEDGKNVIIAKHPGQEYTYENGKFKMTIRKAAEGSWSCSGKLSFWTCLIETPDGQKFDIGINAEYLCETILHNTLINGVVQGDIYLGKTHGNTMAVTKGQPAYIQAMADESKRTTAQSNKYEIGEVVKTLTETEVYAGLWYELFSVDTHEERGWGWNSTSTWRYTLIVHNKPLAKHAFRRCWDETCTKEDRSITLRNTKPKRIQTGIKKPEYIDGIFDKWVESYILEDEERRSNDPHRRPYDEYWRVWGTSDELPGYALTTRRFSTDPNAKIDIDAFVQDLKKHTYRKMTIKVVDDAGNILKEFN